MALKQYKPTPNVAGFINPPTTGDTAARRIRHYGDLTAVLPRDAMLARRYYGPMSVRPSVRVLQAGVLLNGQIYHRANNAARWPGTLRF